MTTGEAPAQATRDVPAARALPLSFAEVAALWHSRAACLPISRRFRCRHARGSRHISLGCRCVVWTLPSCSPGPSSADCTAARHVRGLIVGFSPCQSGTMSGSLSLLARLRPRHRRTNPFRESQHSGLQPRAMVIRPSTAVNGGGPARTAADGTCVTVLGRTPRRLLHPYPCDLRGEGWQPQTGRSTPVLIDGGSVREPSEYAIVGEHGKQSREINGGQGRD